jgi:hypothetical protein
MRPPSGEPAQKRNSNPINDERPQSIHKSPLVAAQGQRAPLNDPDFQTIAEAWDRLPAAVKAGIVAMVKAASR